MPPQKNFIHEFRGRAVFVYRHNANLLQITSRPKLHVIQRILQRDFSMFELKTSQKITYYLIHTNLLCLILIIEKYRGIFLS